MTDPEEQLRKPAALLQLVLRDIDDLVAVLDLEGKRLYNNPSYSKILGKEGILRGTDSFFDIHPDDRQRIRRIFQETVRTGKGQRAEYRFLLDDGSIRYIESVGNVIRDEQGNPENVVVISRDVTTRKEAEQQMRLLAYALTCSRDSISITDTNGTILFVNDAFVSTYGYAQDELVGKKMALLESPSTPPEIAAQILPATLAGGWNGELLHRRKDGSEFPVELLTSVVRNLEDEPIALVGVGRDITDRKHAQEALEHSEQRFRSLIENSSDIIIIADEYQRVLYGSPSLGRTLGYARDDLLGESLQAFLHIDEIPRIVQMFKQALENPGRLFSIEHRMRHKLGTWLVFESLARNITDEQGQRIFVLNSRDITERYRSEALLRDTNRTLEDLIRTSPLAIVTIDRDATVKIWNQAAEQLFGWREQEVLGQTIPHIPKEKMAEFLGRMQRTMPAEAQAGTEVTFLRKDGTTVQTTFWTTHLRNAAGTITGFLGIYADITERKRSEEERARLNSAVEQTAEAVVITDAQATILYVNPAFERITGYKRQEVLGKNPRILKSGKHGQAFYEEMWATLTSGNVWSGHLINRQKNGSLYEEEIVISPVRDSTGKTVNYVGVKRDVTHEMEIERQLRQAQKMESLGQLASGIAHDFNNVLGVIGGSLSLLKARVSEEQLQRYVEMGETAVNRGADVARRLLTFSREEKIQLVPLAAGDLVQELMKVLEHSIEKTITISVEIAPDLALVQGDPGQLYQMLLNLCVNARDAILDPASGKTRGTITIAAIQEEGEDLRLRFPDASADQYVRLSVTDTGMGMTDETRQKIFDPFFTTKPKGKGTGLGLAVVYGIAKSHHGFVDVESLYGRGSTFHIHLPAYAHEPLVVDKVREEPIAGGSETVLVVEDEEGLRMLLTELLQMHGYSVLSAIDGIQAVDAYSAHRATIGAVITDMGLPKLSGAELFDKIKEINPSAKVILASGFLDPKMKSKLFIAGAKAFIQKPYHATEVLRTLREVLDA